MSAGPECAVESCGGEPAADRWTVGLWSATASLFACAYAYAEEGAYDAAGRWRRRQLRHHLAGAAADRVRALAMAAHFCTLVGQLARAHAKARGGTAHARRSFEHGCADRLVARLRVETAARGTQAAAAESHARLLRVAGLVPRACPRPDRAADDRAASRQGKAAADNISLVLRTGSAAPVAASRKPPQLSMF